MYNIEGRMPVCFFNLEVTMGKFRDRLLPNYTLGEELFNMISHIVGGALGVAALVLCIIRAASHGNVHGVVGSAIYGSTMILLYTMSSIYHGLPKNTAKKVFQVLDHCTIYFLISGTYTPIALSAIREVTEFGGWFIFGLEWALTALAVTLTAIDLKKYTVFSMCCYIIMGWCIIVAPQLALAALGSGGFILVLAGGIAYTIGAVTYGIGKKMKYMHSVFHLFVVLGSILQFFGVYLYAI